MSRFTFVLALFAILGASHAHAQDRAYSCTSDLGRLPQVGPLYHASVVICPAGVSPTVSVNGRSYSNPACSYCGTYHGHSTFQADPLPRTDVSCQPSSAPADVVRQRIAAYNQPYRLLTNNCQHAAAWATRP